MQFVNALTPLSRKSFVLLTCAPLVFFGATNVTHAQPSPASESQHHRTEKRNKDTDGNVRIIRDQPYKSGTDLSDYERKRCKLDWYLPSGAKDFPTLVWFHGGGLRNGHKADAIAVTVGKRFSGEGIAVVSVNYRLSPKVNYPAYTEDAAAAVAFVRKTIAQHGGSPDAVFVSGHSAGGYLTSMVGMHPDLLAKHGLKRTDIAGYIPVAGQMVTHSTVRGEKNILRTQPIIDEAAPAFHATADTSPFLCFAGDNDLPARSEENRYFAAVMKAAGHESVRFVEVVGRDHSTVASRMGEAEDEVARAILQFVNEHLNDVSATLRSTVQRLAEAKNYTWRLEVQTTPNRRGRDSTIEGKSDSGGKTYATLSSRRRPVQVVIEGTKAAVTNRDRRWETVSLLDESYRSAGFAPSTAKSIRVPVNELRELLAGLTELRREDAAIVGRLSADQAASYLRSQRGNESEATDAEGTVQFSIENGRLAQYSIHVNGSITFDDETRVRSRQFTTTLTDFDETSLDIPDRAVAALQRPLPELEPRLSDDEADRLLSASGKRAIGVHDPSSIVRCGDEYWMFSTGTGVLSWRSKDLVDWTSGPPVFRDMPDWVPDVVPSQRGHFWAPDVIRTNDRYLLYYSVSSFGSNTSAIALASTPTLNPDDAEFKWTDHGIVTQTSRGDNYNAIDPAIITTGSGELWMSFGSFWTGLKLLQLDPATGKRLDSDKTLYSIAKYRAIEAPHIYYHNGYYYLFVNWDRCCRGVESTYNIRIGRSKSITGPYLDQQGVDLAKGGGTMFLESDGPFIGPGHANVFADDDGYWFSCHYYDGTERGRSMFSIRPLAWSDDGWPELLDAVSRE